MSVATGVELETWHEVRVPKGEGAIAANEGSSSSGRAEPLVGNIWEIRWRRLGSKGLAGDASLVSGTSNVMEEVTPWSADALLLRVPKDSPSLRG